MRLRQISVFMILGIMLIIVLMPRSFAVSPAINQVSCIRYAAVANNQNVSVALSFAGTQGDVLVAVIQVQGQATQKIDYVNFSDGFQFYPEQVRTTDFVNTLIVSIFSGVENHSGIVTAYTQYFSSTSNKNNGVLFCVYELVGVVADPSSTSHQEGGASTLTVGTSGQITISGAVANDGGGAFVFNGTLDSGLAAPANNAFATGHGAGTYSGITGVTFSEEADASWNAATITTVVTSTITGFIVPAFVNGVNNFGWLWFMIIVFVPMGEIIGIMTMEKNSVLDRHAIIFVFLALLLLDSIFGVMLNLVTVAMPFIFGLLFGVYLWRGRG